MDFKKRIDQFIIIDDNDNAVYLYDKLISSFQHRYFGDDHLMIYEQEGIIMNFAFFKFTGGQMNDGNILNKQGELFWHGSGALGNLKELRHSYFPEYVFYASPLFIKQSCDILLEYFEE